MSILFLYLVFFFSFFFVFVSIRSTFVGMVCVRVYAYYVCKKMLGLYSKEIRFQNEFNWINLDFNINTLISPASFMLIKGYLIFVFLILFIHWIAWSRHCVPSAAYALRVNIHFCFPLIYLIWIWNEYLHKMNVSSL